MEIKKVILSRGRANAMSTHHIVHGCILTVCESEYEEYAANYDMPMIIHPDEINTLGKLRNWLRDYYPDDCIVMLDDDIAAGRTLGLISSSAMTPEQIDSVIYSTANAAWDMGVKVFGWNQSGHAMTYNPTNPFVLAKWVGTALGVFPDCQRWDEDIKTKCDIDFSLKELMVNRIIFRDDRYFFQSDRDSKTGGNQQYKTTRQTAEDKEFLKERWGKYVRFTSSIGKLSESTTVSVPRKQKLVIL